MDVATSFLMQQFAPPPHSSPPHQQALHYNYFDRTADPSRRIPLQSSFVRSSAPRQMQHYAPQAMPSSYRSTFSMDSSSSSGTGSYGHDGSPLGSPFDGPNSGLQPPAASGGGQPFPTEAYPHSWPQVAQPSPSQYPDPYPAGSYELPPSASSTSAADGNMMQGVKAEDSLEPYGGAAGGLYLSSYADQLQNAASMPDHQGALPTYSMNQYSPEVVSQQSLGYGYSTADAQPHHPASAEVANVPSYLLGAPTHLQYPDEDIPRYVNPTQVSPGSPYAQLQELPQDQSCDPRFTLQTAHSGASPSAFTDFDVESAASGSPSLASVATSAPIPVPAAGAGAQRKRQRAVSFTSSSSDEEMQPSSGESEHDEDGEGEDEDYVQQSPRTRRRGLSASSTSPSTSTGSFSMARRLAAPVPVPNLTKKSRGRRVPTAQQVGTQGGPQKVRFLVSSPGSVCGCSHLPVFLQRMYMCKVPGCGKCFARGEHLKRHVRSIHTNDKRESSVLRPCARLLTASAAHKCPYPGCEKDFSRHDNLGQHMRVHKGYTMPKAGPL
ncbi:hypothetical protein TRAPUB_4835 [Trametes pubescens]|uniref:C2H2-type domain-containing protein n=1 Tax=Trametes pubescens TaxID=154538 RepID=A0A1M2VAK3_TRAPU|nr:hypothetical protein TRAPUB_4835 [Trametes pubescens]